MPKLKTEATEQKTATVIKEPKPDTDRPVKYPNPKMELRIGDKAVTCTEMKNLLGWEVIPEGAGREGVALLEDFEGNKIRCIHNWGNRAFNFDHADEICQDILRGNWRFNGEPIVIGKTGRGISLQHRGVGLILACQRWNDTKVKHRYKKVWPEEPRLETAIMYGIEEDPETIRTIDNTAPRKMSDVFYTDPKLGFPKLKPDEREKMTHILEQAIRYIWYRTAGPKVTGLSHLTNSETINYANKHPKILQCIGHILKESVQIQPQPDGGSKKKDALARYGPKGRLAALLYLQGCCGSDRDAYAKVKPLPSEKVLDWTHWEKALDFWTRLALAPSNDETLKWLYFANRPDANTGKPETEDYVFPDGRGDEKVSVIAKAWLQFLFDEPVTSENIQLSYKKKQDKDPLGNDIFVNGRVETHYSISAGLDMGIDIVNVSEEEPEETNNNENEEKDDPEEIAARTKAEKEASLQRKREGKKSSDEGLTEEGKAAQEEQQKSLRGGTNS
jgi:hypothetical protein